MTSASSLTLFPPNVLSSFALPPRQCRAYRNRFMATFWDYHVCHVVEIPAHVTFVFMLSSPTLFIYIVLVVCVFLVFGLVRIPFILSPKEQVGYGLFFGALFLYSGLTIYLLYIAWVSFVYICLHCTFRLPLHPWQQEQGDQQEQADTETLQESAETTTTLTVAEIV
jgi:hypothetical protein